MSILSLLIPLISDRDKLALLSATWHNHTACYGFIFTLTSNVERKCKRFGISC